MQLWSYVRLLLYFESVFITTSLSQVSLAEWVWVLLRLQFQFVRILLLPLSFSVRKC